MCQQRLFKSRQLPDPTVVRYYVPQSFDDLEVHWSRTFLELLLTWLQVLGLRRWPAAGVTFFQMLLQHFTVVGDLREKSLVILPSVLLCYDNCARRDLVTYGDVTSENECKWFQSHLIYSPETNMTLILTSLTIYYHLNTLIKVLWECSLCARWVLFVTPDSSFLLPSAPCCLLPCWELTAYLASCLGGLALLHPLPLRWPHFPQVPGSALPLCQVQ